MKKIRLILWVTLGVRDNINKTLNDASQSSTQDNGDDDEDDNAFQILKQLLYWQLFIISPCKSSGR